jgi:lysine-specific histone demethylase 1B
MERRDFIKQSTFFSIGGLLIPSLFLSSCRKELLLEDFQYTGKVLIIGAGAAGLYAGYILKSKGIDFQILEASANYGGRIGKLSGFAKYPLDLGAQWLHGKNSIVGELVSQSGAKITLDNSDEKYWFKNKIVSSLPKDINTIFTRETNLPDISFKDFAIQEGFGNDYNNIVEGIAGDSGAAASRISAYWKIKEEENWISGDDDFKFEETYFDLIDSQIASKVQDNIKLNTIVKKINYTESSIVITDSNNNTYSGDKVIVTVPITILKSNAIEFIPSLSLDKTTAFSKIGMDAGMKVFLKFNNKFFDQNIIGGSTSASYSDESIGKQQDDNVLLAFIMGKQAEYLTSLGNEEQIKNALLQELDSMYNGQASASFISYHVQNWTTNPFIKGAYSYSTIGMGDARQISAQSINKKIYFAGEAMNFNGHHQTVHGAIETGYREVINILNDIKK